MKDQHRRNWLIPAIIGVVLLLLAALFLLRPFHRSENPSVAPAAYFPGDYPNGVRFADIAADSLSDQARFAAYDDDNDPVHPVLDVKVQLFISNLGSRPGSPRSQDAAHEYPAPDTEPPAVPAATATAAPSATLRPGMVIPGIKPGVNLPDITLPELYILEPDVLSPQFTGSSYTISWEYTAGRNVVYAVSISADGGKTFKELATVITGESYELTFPDTPAKHCVLRVTALMDGRVYMAADTNGFELVAAPEPAPARIEKYVDPQVQYVDIPGMRISSASRLPVWFKAESSAENAKKLIWQLSKVPFWGTKESFENEAGIIANGEVPNTGGEFSIDLAALCEELTKPGSADDTGKPFLLPQAIYDFYLRVVALDGHGECIGDPGRGLAFSYGVPNVAPGSNAAAVAEDPKIQLQVYVPYYWEHRWERITPRVLDRDLKDESDCMLFAGTDGPHDEGSYPVVSGIEDALDTAVDEIEDAVDGQQEEKGVGSRIISKAVQVEIQVATSPFTDAGALGMTQPDGLVYSYLDTAPDIGKSDEYGYTYYTPSSHGIEYEQFVPSQEELDGMGGIYYYVRGIFYVPDSENSSVLRPYPSETLTVAFRATDATHNEIKKFTVKSDIPYVYFRQYYPAQWQDPNYDEYFEVTRHIEAEEMNFNIANTETGDFLLPYKLHIAMYGWTREQYQAKLDEMLPKGASFHYRKSDPGFWDEFFGLLKAIYSGVSGAYANAKAAAVSLVDYIPLIGDDARGYLKKAASYAIDYGLASIGLPPSLPNIDQLAEGGLDYVMRVAVDEALRSAGVPADSPAAAEITEEVCGRVADGVSDELTKAILAQQQNPFHADFLRLATEKLYKPAYIDVFVINFSKTRTSRAGEVCFSSGNGFDVYKSKSVYIPQLKPGESVTVRMYLDHYRNKYDGYNAYFDKLYKGNGDQPYKMTVYTCFELPDVRQAAKEQGIEPAPLPYVSEFTYDHSAYSYRYEREFVPAEPIWEIDSSPNAQDFMD